MYVYDDSMHVVEVVAPYKSNTHIYIFKGIKSFCVKNSSTNVLQDENSAQLWENCRIPNGIHIRGGCSYEELFQS